MAEALARIDETVGAQETDQPHPPSWKYWRERGFVRLWQAAMLSLNYEPSVENRELLRLTLPTQYTEYRRRKDVLEMQYGHHRCLRTVEHHRQGEEIRNRYIAWANFVAFSTAMEWGDVKEYEQKGASSLSLLVQSRGVPIDEVDDELLEVTPVILLGAVLDVLERSLRAEAGPLAGKSDRPVKDEEPLQARQLLKGPEEQINISRLAETVIQGLGKRRTPSATGFGPDNVQLLLRTARHAYNKAKSGRA